MLMLMSLALMPTEKEHLRAKNNNLRAFCFIVFI